MTKEQLNKVVEKADLIFDKFHNLPNNNERAKLFKQWMVLRKIEGNHIYR